MAKKTFYILCWFCSIFTLSEVLLVAGDSVDLCPSNLHRDKYLSSYNGKCIQIVTQKQTWVNAYSDCQRRGGELLQIRSAGKQNFIAQKLKQLNFNDHSFWIGATDRQKEGNWEWASGNRIMTYENWGKGQGPNRGTQVFNGVLKDCAQLQTDDNYRWHDVTCGGFSSYYYICQYEELKPKVQATTQRPFTFLQQGSRVIPKTPFEQNLTAKLHKTPMTRKPSRNPAISPSKLMINHASTQNFGWYIRATTKSRQTPSAIASRVTLPQPNMKVTVSNVSSSKQHGLPSMTTESISVTKKAPTKALDLPSTTSTAETRTKSTTKVLVSETRKQTQTPTLTTARSSLATRLIPTKNEKVTLFSSEVMLTKGTPNSQATEMKTPIILTSATYTSKDIPVQESTTAGQTKTKTHLGSTWETKVSLEIGSSPQQTVLPSTNASPVSIPGVSTTQLNRAQSQNVAEQQGTVMMTPTRKMNPSTKTTKLISRRETVQTPTMSMTVPTTRKITTTEQSLTKSQMVYSTPLSTKRQTVKSTTNARTTEQSISVFSKRIFPFSLTTRSTALSTMSMKSTAKTTNVPKQGTKGYLTTRGTVTKQHNVQPETGDTTAPTTTKVTTRMTTNGTPTVTSTRIRTGEGLSTTVKSLALQTKATSVPTVKTRITTTTVKNIQTPETKSRSPQISQMVAIESGPTRRPTMLPARSSKVIKPTTIPENKSSKPVTTSGNTHEDIRETFKVSCPANVPRDNYTWIYKRHCIQIVPKKRNWNDGRADCLNRNGDLIQIRSLGWQLTVELNLKRLSFYDHKLWIGASDSHHEGRWEWTTGRRSMTYVNWSPGEGPEHRHGFIFSSAMLQDCAQIQTTDDFRWHDMPCDSNYYYICQYDAVNVSTSQPTSTTVKTRKPGTTLKTKESTRQLLTETTKQSPSVKIADLPTAVLTVPQKTDTQMTTKMHHVSKTKKPLSKTSDGAIRTVTTRTHTTKTPSLLVSTISSSPFATNGKEMPTAKSQIMNLRITTPRPSITKPKKLPTTTTTTTQRSMTRRRYTGQRPAASNAKTITYLTGETHAPVTRNVFTLGKDSHGNGGTANPSQKGTDSKSTSYKSLSDSKRKTPTVTIVITSILGVLSVGTLVVITITILRRRYSARDVQETSMIHEIENAVYGYTYLTSGTDAENTANEMLTSERYNMHIGESTS